MPQSEARPTTTVMRRGRRCRRTISMHWRHASQPASALSGHATRAERNFAWGGIKRTAGVTRNADDPVVGTRLLVPNLRPLRTRRAFLGAQLRGG